MPRKQREHRAATVMERDRDKQATPPRYGSPAFWDDLLWIHEHAGELCDQYEDEWVAVVNHRVVAHGYSLDKVKKEAMRVSGRDRSEIPVFYAVSGAAILWCGCGS